MNMQKLMQEAQKMQVQLQKEQKELEKNVYMGKSSLITVEINGKYEVVSVKFNSSEMESIDTEDLEMLEDMIMVATNDALKKIAEDKNNRMSKYGAGLAGLM